MSTDDKDVREDHPGFIDADMSMAMGDGQIAVRLNDLDLTRATEQSAILLSLAMGRGVETKKKGSGSRTKKKADEAGTNPSNGGDQELHGIRKETIEPWALRSILGYLQDSYCIGSIAFREPSDEKGRVGKLWKKLPRPCGREDARREGSPMQLEFVVRPIDGVEDLRAGLSGTVAALAGGPPESFVEPSAERFFVLAVNPILAAHLQKADKTIQETRQQIPIAKVVVELASWINEAAEKNRPEFTIGSMAQDYGLPFRSIQSELSKFCRLRVFTGSPIAAAIATFVRRFSNDVFVGEMSKAQIAMTAVAACATGGYFFAVPTTEVAVSKGAKMLCTESTKYLTLKDFLRYENGPPDVFLVITGITDSIVLQGVRFHDNRSVSTDTMCLRSSTQSIRSITHRHDLDQKKFRLMPEKGKGKTPDVVRWPQVLNEFRRMLGEVQSEEAGKASH